MLDASILSTVALTTTTLAAALSAIFSARALGQAARATQITVYLELSNRYRQPDMHEALLALIGWRKEAGDEFAELWRGQLDAGDARAAKLDAARRGVSMYFDDIARLHRQGLLSRKAARMLIGTYGLNVYLDIACPMSWAHAEGARAPFHGVISRLMPHYAPDKV